MCLLGHGTLVRSGPTSPGTRRLVDSPVLHPVGALVDLGPKKWEKHMGKYRENHGVLKKLGRWEHRSLLMIAPFPLWKKNTSIQYSQWSLFTKLNFHSIIGHTVFFSLRVEYINKHLEVLQIAVFVTSDTLREMYKMKHVLNPLCFLSRASQDTHRRVRDFHQ